MPGDRAQEDRLLESVADGTAVDWTAAETRAIGEADKRRVRNLRLVARVAALHRSLSGGVDAPPPADAAAAAGEDPRAWGHLEVRERLGGGSFGTLYRARDPQLDRDVALKLLRPGVSAMPDAVRLLAEARTLARVRHPNVVVVHGADVRDGRPGLWMELIDGHTLEARVQERGPASAAETVAIGRDLCGALAAVHAAHLVHGDVKAQNVMRDAGGRTVLMDFGAGRAQGAESPTAGTPLYLAPEVLAGEPSTPQSDIYSLGVLLFYLLTGRFPCSGGDIEELRQAHAAGARANLRELRPDLPARLVECIERALDPDPAARFPTAAEMDQALSGHRAWTRASGTLLAGLALALIITVAVIAPRLRPGPVPPAVGVLAFTTAVAAGAHLVEGLSDDVMRHLQRFQLNVKRADLPSSDGLADDVFERMGAETLVRGSADGKALRISIVRAGPSEIWAREYPLDEGTVPGLGPAIAADIAGVLRASLRSDAAPAPHQASYPAYDAYQRGRAAAAERTSESLMRSLEYFKQAIALDAGYAEPWAGMADAYLTLGVPPFGAMPPADAQRLSREAAEEALRRNANLVEAHTSMAFAALLYEYDWEAAEQRFLRAIEINPQYALAHLWYASYLTDMGRFHEAHAALNRAREIQPLSTLIARDFAWIFIHQNRYEDAITQLRRTLEHDPDYTPARTLLARALANVGRLDEALAALEHERPNISAGSYLSFRAHAEAINGHPRARETLAELRQVAETEYVTPYFIAMVHSALGDATEAIEELERAVRERDPQVGTMNVDPRFAPIRRDPRFQALIARLEFPNPER